MKLFVEVFRERSSAVKCQVIQSVSILLMNISKRASLCELGLCCERVCQFYCAALPLLPPTVYFLSNNHVNDLISSRVDPSDEELVAYYISFLKTLSLCALRLAASVALRLYDSLDLYRAPQVDDSRNNSLLFHCRATLSSTGPGGWTTRSLDSAPRRHACPFPTIHRGSQVFQAPRLDGPHNCTYNHAQCISW